MITGVRMKDVDVQVLELYQLFKLINAVRIATEKVPREMQVHVNHSYVKALNESILEEYESEENYLESGDYDEDDYDYTHHICACFWVFNNGSDITGEEEDRLKSYNGNVILEFDIAADDMMPHYHPFQRYVKNVSIKVDPNHSEYIRKADTTECVITPALMAAAQFGNDLENALWEDDPVLLDEFRSIMVDHTSISDIGFRQFHYYKLDDQRINIGLQLELGNVVRTSIEVRQDAIDKWAANYALSDTEGRNELIASLSDTTVDVHKTYRYNEALSSFTQGLKALTAYRGVDQASTDGDISIEYLNSIWDDAEEETDNILSELNEYVDKEARAIVKHVLLPLALRAFKRDELCDMYKKHE